MTDSKSADDELDKIFQNRGNWRFNRTTKQFERFTPQPVEVRAHMIITDEMPPTRHPSDGKIYTSRKKYHAATRAYGLEYYDDTKGKDEYFQNEADKVTANEEDIMEDVNKAYMQLKYNEAPMTEDERQLARKADEISIAQADNKPENTETVTVKR